MKPWSKRPGEKVIITRRALEDLVHHLENPDLFAPNQYYKTLKLSENNWQIGRTNLNRKFDSIKRTRVLLNLALDHFHQSERFENSGDLEDARYELATADEYRDMYWYRTESEERGTDED